MTISMYQVSVPIFIRYMNHLRQILEKGEAYAEEKNFEPEVLINARLAPDMFTLVKQIQVVTDVARRCIARLVDDELVSIEDNEQTFADLYQRINTTIDYLESIKPEQIDGTEDKNITMKFKSHSMDFKGMNFVLYFSMPNVYFHVTTVYNILRNNGVALRKPDYTGELPV